MQTRFVARLRIHLIEGGQMAKKDDVEVLEVHGRAVRVTHPGKLYFSRETTLTKIELVRYYLAVAPGAVAGIRDRPVVLKRFVNGAEGEPFYQKRAPEDRPEWLRTVTLSFPSGRTADEIVVDDAAGLAWIVNLGCMELHPHPVRTGNLDHPDELRIDLDPGPGVAWDDVRRVAGEVSALLGEVGLTGWPKTSGSRGMHINVRIEPRWSFTEVRRAALAMARAVERRAPGLASSKWWKEERHGVFLDYNQNAKDRTTCSAYSVRPVGEAQVSAPLTWAEVPMAEMRDFTVRSMPERFAGVGDVQAGMDGAVGSLEALLELAARDEHEGLGDAPWPPHFAKAEGEGPRVAPSRARSAKSFSGQMGEGFGAHRFRRQSAKLAAAAAGEAAAKASGVGETVAAGEVLKAPRKRAAKKAGAAPSGASADEEAAAGEAGAVPAKPMVRRGRVSSMPLVTVANSPNKDEAMAGLERWKTVHPTAAGLLAVDDVLVDRMRGSAYVWYRVRVNLRHVPEGERPAQGVPDPDEDPTRGWKEAGASEG